MKIEFHTNNFPPKRFIGAELYDLELMKKLRDLGNDITVVVRGDDTWEYDGFQVTNIPGENVDIVFCHFDNTVDAMLSAYKTGAKVIGIGHNTMEASISTAQYTKLDGLIFNSETMKNIVGDTVTENKMVIIPPVPKPKKRIIKQGEKFISVNQTPAKGGVIFKCIAEELPEKEFIAILGGWGEQVKAILPNVQLIENSKTAYNKTIREARAMVLAASDESWGMAASEAIANGVPVIYHSHLDGVSENVGNAGMKVPAGNFMAWVKTVDKNDFPNAATCLKKAEENYIKHCEQLEQLDEFIRGL